MSKPQHLTILGGGPAGLSVGYYARKNQIPFTLYEAGPRIGGNCVTFEHGGFYFDSGAHRFHDKDPEVTNEVKSLLGADLQRNDTPSQIYQDGKFIDFPLSPLNLLKNLGPITFTKAGLELLSARLSTANTNGSFESFALRTYGRTIAERFLLNYSGKLWGASADHLSPYIAGTRMKGLGLKTFVTEAIFGRKAKIEHLDGAFYYPRMGIGMIADKLGEFCGGENIIRNSRISRILHDGKRIVSIEINGKNIVETDHVVSTLPLSLLIRMMDPGVDASIIELTKSLRFRNLILVALFLNRESVTENATLYFPDSNFLFTRVYEPKKRSLAMAPAGQTSLISEVPCQNDDTVWKLSDEKLIAEVRSKLCEVCKIKSEEVIGTLAIRIPHAYPILEKGFEEKVQQIFRFLEPFTNLKLAGRNGKFTYTSIHNMMRFGKEAVEEYLR